MLYFYTDPLAPAWMAKHFGMRFNVQGIEIIAEDESILICAGERFYIHPDSVNLLEPQVGDIILNAVKDRSFLIPDWLSSQDAQETRYKKFYTSNCNALRQWVPVSSKTSIIQRNGIPFHWPQSEE